MNLPIFTPNQVTDETEPPVNGRGQFGILTPEGKLKWYTRCTTFIDCLSDKTKLTDWKKRTILTGAYVQPSILDAVSKVDLTNKRDMDIFTEAAFVAGDGYLKATKGTDLHRLFELWDTMQPIDPGSLTAEDDADLREWIRITSKLGWLHREQRVVIDFFGVTGTPDGIATYTCLDGRTRNVIADLKTGSIKYDPGKIAMQEAMYAAGELYDHQTGTRTPLPQVSREIGLLIHLPAGSGEATLYEVDLTIGWAGIGKARQVREWRNYSKKVLHEVPK